MAVNKKLKSLTVNNEDGNLNEKVFTYLFYSILMKKIYLLHFLII